ncbi:MAG: hypothetical protein ACHQIO_23495, partial [Nevskiales bacterium]
AQLHAAGAGSAASLHGDSVVPASSSSIATAASASAASGGGTAAAPVSPSSVLNSSDVSAVLVIVQAFSAEVGSHLAMLVTTNQVIAYDSYAVAHTPAAVTAVTYDFADGSFVSLVGLPAELPHALA